MHALFFSLYALAITLYIIHTAGSTATPSVDDNLIQSIVESEAFKAAAASVGVSTAGASMSTSSTSSSEGSLTSSSSLLNSGATVANDATTMLGHGAARGVAAQSTSVMATSEQ